MNSFTSSVQIISKDIEDLSDIINPHDIFYKFDYWVTNQEKY